MQKYFLLLENIFTCYAGPCPGSGRAARCSWWRRRGRSGSWGPPPPPPPPPAELLARLLLGSASWSLTLVPGIPGPDKWQGDISTQGGIIIITHKNNWLLIGDVPFSIKMLKKTVIFITLFLILYWILNYIVAISLIIKATTHRTMQIKYICPKIHPE